MEQVTMIIESKLISLGNPVFQVYTMAASIMILKLMLQPWMTVARMLKANAGFRSPEDIKKSPVNPNPNPSQLEVNEYVDRSRRINLNDLESIPGFLAAGFLFVLVNPPLLFAQIVIWGYVIARAAHFLAYITAQLHDIRATFWSFSSIAVLTMAVYTFIQAF